MKKKLIALCIILSTNPAHSVVQAASYTQLEIPAYAKWGKLAIIEAHKKYPHAKIVDYLHEGNEVTSHSTIEHFKLWLKEDGHEFGVFIKIEFNTKTEKVLNIEMEETDR